MVTTAKPKPKPGEPRKKPRPQPQRWGLPRIAKSLPYEDYIATLFERHVDIRSRTIFLNSIHVDTDRAESGTDASMHDLCTKALTLLEQQNPKKPIKISTANFGGLLYHALGIYNRIKLSPCRIVIHGYGPIMSAGSIIFQAGDERLLAPDATMMLHYGEDSIDSMRSQDRDSLIAEHKRVDRRLLEIYLDRIKQSGKRVFRNELNEKIHKTLFLTAEQAVEMGLADGIITKP